jgi:hypothetical protein
VKLIVEWCIDDNDINVLYKNDGTERYPDFKLYKMIARTVHNHVPSDQTHILNNYIFDAHEDTHEYPIMNIDTMIN